MSQRYSTRGMRPALLGCAAFAALAAASSAMAQSGGGGSPGGSPSEQPSPSSTPQGASAPAASQAGSPQVGNTAAPPSTAARNEGTALQEIVVTAQKRAQNLQDVPISVTAITASTLQAQRISSVEDLSSVAPNLTVRPAAGGAGLPAFSMRGINSYGVVPGSDKEISIYIDGVYLGNTFGSAFDIPDIERIEVLHGPQGTLFGRNATAGAISIITPDPPHKFGFHQEASFGNYDEKRSKTRVDTGDFGPFSMTLSYVHDQRNGDIKNTGAGTVWHYPNVPFEPSTQVSPKYLGSKDANEYFGALKFQPNSKLKAIYKFDYTENHFTPEANVPVGTNFPYVGAAASSILTTFLANNPAIPLDTNVKRPDSVNNSFTTPGYSRNYGHNLTVTYQINDNLSFKNIASYRTSFIYSNDQLDGFGGIAVTPATVAALGGLGPFFAPNINAPLSLFSISTENRANQWSDESQINYDTKYLTLTLGSLFYHQNAASGAPPGIPNNYALNVFPGNTIPGLSELGFGPAAGEATSYNRSSSTAGYIQAEVHVLPTLDVVGGYRTTTDDKTGSFFFSSAAAPLTFTYDKTKPSYLIGINYKPERDILLYTKYSTAFVSGGAEGPAAFAPETVESYEGGIKGDFLRHRVQADLSVFSARYANLQSAQSGANVGLPQIGTAIVDLGGEKARGFEFQGTAIPIRHLTLGVGVGFTDFHFTSVNPVLGTLDTYLPSLEPKWTVAPSAQYETDPLFRDARMLFRLDANWRSRERLDANNLPSDTAAFPGLIENPSAWELNARIALEHIDVLYGTAQIALWGKNLTQDRSPTFPDDFFFVAASSFVPARTYGIDLIYDF